MTSALWIICFTQSLFQETAAHPELQHHEVHLQHGDHDEGEGEHSLLLPPAPRHDAVHGGLPHGQSRAQRGFVSATEHPAVVLLKKCFGFMVKKNTYSWPFELSASGFRFSGRRRSEHHWELWIRPHRRHRSHGHGRWGPLLQLHQGHCQPPCLQEQQVVRADDVSLQLWAAFGAPVCGTWWDIQVELSDVKPCVKPAGICSTTRRWNPSTRHSLPLNVLVERWRYELQSNKKNMFFF